MGYGDVETWERSCAAGGSVEQHNPFSKQPSSFTEGETWSHHITQQFQHHVYTNRAEHICSEKNLYSNTDSVYSLRIIAKENKIQVSINWWKDKQNVCLYNGTVFSNNKESSTQMSYNMNGTWKYYANNSHQRLYIVWIQTSRNRQIYRHSKY